MAVHGDLPIDGVKARQAGATRPTAPPYGHRGRAPMGDRRGEPIF